MTIWSSCAILDGRSETYRKSSDEVRSEIKIKISLRSPFCLHFSPVSVTVVIIRLSTWYNRYWWWYSIIWRSDIMSENFRLCENHPTESEINYFHFVCDEATVLQFHDMNEGVSIILWGFIPNQISACSPAVTYPQFQDLQYNIMPSDHFVTILRTAGTIFITYPNLQS